jgi:hypothetical protein
MFLKHATNSISIVDAILIVCFALFYEIASREKTKKQTMDLFVSTHPAKSESDYVTILR